MAKRGTKKLDNYPNYMTGTANQSSADTATNFQFSTPIPRLQTRGNKATVMELLWIDMKINCTLNAVGETFAASFYGGQATTSEVLISDPRAIGNIAFDATDVLTSGSYPTCKNNWRIDLQSTDGYGFLFAGDIINVNVVSANTGASNRVDFRIYYRFVEIPITEFVGLVQSQQQGSSS